MRPLSIWGMQYAWENIVPEELKQQMGNGTITTLQQRLLAKAQASAQPTFGAETSERGLPSFGTYPSLVGAPVAAKKVRKV